MWWFALSILKILCFPFYEFLSLLWLLSILSAFLFVGYCFLWWLSMTDSLLGSPIIFSHLLCSVYVFPQYFQPPFSGGLFPRMSTMSHPLFLYKFLFEGCFPSLHHENPDASLLCDHGTFTWLINSIPSGDQCGKMSCFLFELIARYCWFMSKVTSLWLCN